MPNYLAFDFGAESGRAILGGLENGVLRLTELHRFPNTPVRVFNSLYWDTLRLWHETRQGLAAALKTGASFSGIGIDTWGVDFGLIGADGLLLGGPQHYRDPRTNGMMEKLFETVPRETVFEHTGLQFMQLNSLFQLYAMKQSGSPALALADKLLFMPDLFNYWLTGVAKAELTIVSTSQMYDPRKTQWATGMLEQLGLPTHILPEIVAPGTRLGTALDTGIPVFATAGHDTASAVAAVPAEEGSNWCYISSGTWSLMGVELEEPVVNAECAALNFTNEIGAAGRIRLLKNIAGLWLLQECRRAWIEAGTEFSYEELVLMGAGARPFSALINPDAFLEPGEMPRKIADFCASTGQAPPKTPAEYVRAILESLALRYRAVLESLESLTGKPIDVIHIVGGGSKNGLLNQFVADATGRVVIAGPAEATATGNVLVQAIGSGLVQDLAEARRIVARSFEVTRVEPNPQADWDAAYRRYCEIAR